MTDKYEIRSKHGLLVPYKPRSYDMACRVAFYMRAESAWEYMVNVVGGRCVSEVCDTDKSKDAYALRVAQRLLA